MKIRITFELGDAEREALALWMRDEEGGKASYQECRAFILATVQSELQFITGDAPGKEGSP